jgi:hypothetical protein
MSSRLSNHYNAEMSEHATFCRLLTPPFGGLTDHKTLEWVISQTPSMQDTGPFPAPHLASIGVKLPGMGSGFHRGRPRDKIVYEYNSHVRVRDFEHSASNWLISDAARSVLERFARDAIDLALADGLCPVQR